MSNDNDTMTSEESFCKQCGTIGSVRPTNEPPEYDLDEIAAIYCGTVQVKQKPRNSLTPDYCKRNRKSELCRYLIRNKL